MPLLGPLAALLGVEIGAITDRVRSTAMAYAAIVFFGLVAVVFLLAAAYLALAEQVGGIYSALIIGAVFLAIALTVYMVLSLGEARRKRELAERRRASEAGAFATTAALTALPAVVRSPALRILAVPAIAAAAFFLVRNGTKGSREE